MFEFELIDSVFKSLTTSRDDVICGIGDDGAVINVPEGYQLVTSTDTLVLGQHFLPTTSAYDIGYKSIAVNISDMAAMGAKPAWAMLCLTLPEPDQAWLSEFANGMSVLLKQYGIQLVGGDTTKGPLAISIQIMGLVEKGRALTRSGAKPGDHIYVTGTLGLPSLALEHLLAEQPMPNVLAEALWQPKPQVEIGLEISQFATAAIDISDGLSGDLSHILQASQVGAVLYEQHLPIASTVLQSVSKDKAVYMALHGGDEYQLCFTVTPEHPLYPHAQQFGAYIGNISSSSGLFLKEKTSTEPQALSISSFQHFNR